MRRIVKMFSLILVVLLISSIFMASYSFAAPQIDKKSDRLEGGEGQVKSSDDVTSDIMGHAKDAKTEKVTSLGGKIVGVVQAVATVIAIVMLLIVGITYLTKSPEGKAEYKKTMGNYIVGALLIFGAASIVNILYNVSKGLE